MDEILEVFDDDGSMAAMLKIMNENSLKKQELKITAQLEEKEEEKK